MLRLIVLGSGSSGNAAVLCTGKTRILIDAGLGIRTLRARLAEAQVDPSSLSGILLTHEHSDHTAGLTGLCKRHSLPIYCNALTAHSLQSSSFLKNYAAWKIFETGAEFSLGGLRIQSFSTPHDAADPVGFTIHDTRHCLGILTDIGYAPGHILHHLEEVGSLYIEANHDEHLLQEDTKRPWSVKQRILSRHGHLSNKAAAEIVCHLAKKSLRNVIAAHLSRDCNRPDIVRKTILSELQRENLDPVQIVCTSQERILIVRLSHENTLNK